MNKEDAKLKELVHHWGGRLEALGPQLKALRDDPESFTREEAEALLKETDKVFKAWQLIQVTLNLRNPDGSMK